MLWVLTLKTIFVANISLSSVCSHLLIVLFQIFLILGMKNDFSIKTCTFGGYHVLRFWILFEFSISAAFLWPHHSRKWGGWKLVTVKWGQKSRLPTRLPLTLRLEGSMWPLVRVRCLAPHWVFTPNSWLLQRLLLSMWPPPIRQRGEMPSLLLGGGEVTSLRLTFSDTFLGVGGRLGSL